MDNFETLIDETQKLADDHDVSFDDALYGVLSGTPVTYANSAPGEDTAMPAALMEDGDMEEGTMDDTDESGGMEGDMTGDGDMDDPMPGESGFMVIPSPAPADFTALGEHSVPLSGVAQAVHAAIPVQVTATIKKESWANSSYETEDSIVLEEYATCAIYHESFRKNRRTDMYIMPESAQAALDAGIELVLLSYDGFVNIQTEKIPEEDLNVTFVTYPVRNGNG